MSITTELREFVDGLACHKVTRDLLCEIADRIDEELANYVELPKDADGEYIHIGDELEYKYGRFVVSQLTFYVVDGKKGLFWSSDDPINEEWVGLSGQCGVPLARHVQPDSWERIIEDAQADGVRYHNEGKPSDFEALVERCKRLCEQERANEV